MDRKWDWIENEILNWEHDPRLGLWIRNGVGLRMGSQEKLRSHPELGEIPCPRGIPDSWMDSQALEILGGIPEPPLWTAIPEEFQNPVDPSRFWRIQLQNSQEP